MSIIVQADMVSLQIIIGVFLVKIYTGSTVIKYDLILPNLNSGLRIVSYIYTSLKNVLCTY